MSRIIELNDEITLSRIIKDGGDVNYDNKLEISSVVHYDDIKHFTVKNSNINIFRYGDGSKEFFVGEKPDWFTPSSVEDLIKNGDTFLFEEPEDTENIIYDCLEFTNNFHLDDESYSLIFKHTLAKNNIVTSFALYGRDIDNNIDKYVFIIWTGSGKNALIELFDGYVVEESDINIIG